MKKLRLVSHCTERNKIKAKSTCKESTSGNAFSDVGRKRTTILQRNRESELSMLGFPGAIFLL